MSRRKQAIALVLDDAKREGLKRIDADNRQREERQARAAKAPKTEPVMEPAERDE